MNRYELEKILSTARNGQGLSRDAVMALLGLSKARHIDALFKAARRVREKISGKGIFLYGFLYTSTHCRNNCHFCKFRRENTGFRRYRKSFDDVVAAADRLARSGVHLIDLTMGEDPALFNHGTTGFDGLVALVRTVRSTTGLPVMVSPGLVPLAVLRQLAAAGADWYACYQETHCPDLFGRLRTGQSFDRRMAAKKDAHRAGLLVEEGILCGIGESHRQVADSLEAMMKLEADQVRAMNFLPQSGTPLAQHPMHDNLRERMIIAVMRLAFPEKLIPASLDVEGLEGLGHRLDAGANVVTSLVPPGKGFSGVASTSRDIDNARRTVPVVRQVVEANGLEVASPEALREWIDRRRQRLKGAFQIKGAA